jgi:FkbM family methyltransferase
LPARLTRWAQAQPDNWLGNRLGFVLRKLVLLNRREIIDGDLWGLKVRWHPLDNVTDRHAFFLPQTWDAQEREFQNLHLSPDGVYLDVGANSGLYSLLALSRLDERGTLVAMEPNPVMFERLKVNIALNEPRARLRLFDCGIAEREGTFTLNLMDRNLGASSISHRPPGEASVLIACRPLLDLVRAAGLERIDFMKIDIEGYEAPALNAFFEEAPQSLWPRFINIESPAGVRLEERGYRVMQRTSQNTLLGLSRS